MFSSGLFLLPGLAAAKGGPAAVLAYLIAGVLAVPAMLSVAELATAMPRAGGAYYFLERALGPAVGTVAGAATWLSLVLKDAFALVGMSAYLNIVVDVDSKVLAIALIVVFTAVNIVGSKASAALQLILVAFVLVVMAWFLLAGLPDVGRSEGTLTPFFETGLSGVVAVVGLVFVSYGGLTNVASAAEEIEDPSRNVPLGMALSLLVGTVVYTLAVLVAVAIVPVDELHEDLAPIHTAAETILPAAGAVFIVVAALAAFSSAANAGILAAARYPMAMSRDGLLSARFKELSRFSTPTLGIIATGVGMAAVVLIFDAGAIAKLASAFVLMTLGLVNVAVIVLRASGIRSYAPRFRAPLFPWLQVAGIGVSVFLIVELGALSLGLVAGSIVVALCWYQWYGRPRAADRSGAIYHVFERWGRSADRSLDREISAAMQSHGLRADDEYPGLVARAAVISIPKGADIAEAAARASEVLSRRTGVVPEEVTAKYLETGSLWIQPSERHPTATPVAFFDIDEDHLVIARAEADEGIRIPATWGGHGESVGTLFFVAGCSDNPGRALRLTGELAAYLHADRGNIADAVFETEVKAALLPGQSIVQYPLLPELPSRYLIGQRVGQLVPPAGMRLEAVRRDGKVIRAHGELVLEADDQLTVIGPPGEPPDAEQLASVLLSGIRTNGVRPNVTDD